MAKKAQTYAWNPLDWLLSDLRASLSLEARGLYRDLLDLCYIDGSLPSDLNILSVKLGGGIDAALLAAVLEHFIPHPSENGRLTHTLVLDHQDNRRRLSENGSMGNAQRWRRR
jgi:hypothetical protein